MKSLNRLAIEKLASKGQPITSVEATVLCQEHDQAIESLRSELEAARAALEGLLTALDKVNDGCEDVSWGGYENGNGEEVGAELDLAIKNARANLSNHTKDTK